MGIKFKGPAPGRNDLCPCKSGLKFKFCHGDPGKAAVCDRVAFEHMSLLIIKEQHKHKIISDEQYKAFMEKYKSDFIPKPVTDRDVNELIASTGLTRCACGTPIPSNCKLCVKCKRKK
jgi:hypothetical protein